MFNPVLKLVNMLVLIIVDEVLPTRCTLRERIQLVPLVIVCKPPKHGFESLAKMLIREGIDYRIYHRVDHWENLDQHIPHKQEQRLVCVKQVREVRHVVKQDYIDNTNWRPANQEGCIDYSYRFGCM